MHLPKQKDIVWAWCQEWARVGCKPRKLFFASAHLSHDSVRRCPSISDNVQTLMKEGRPVTALEIAITKVAHSYGDGCVPARIAERLLRQGVDPALLCQASSHNQRCIAPASGSRVAEYMHVLLLRIPWHRCSLSSKNFVLSSCRCAVNTITTLSWTFRERKQQV